MTKQENRDAGAAAAGQGQQQKASPSAEQLVRAALPHAPKDGSMEAKAEFIFTDSSLTDTGRTASSQDSWR